jgi:hypothetical protein
VDDFVEELASHLDVSSSAEGWQNNYLLTDNASLLGYVQILISSQHPS